MESKKVSLFIWKKCIYFNNFLQCDDPRKILCPFINFLRFHWKWNSLNLELKNNLINEIHQVIIIQKVRHSGLHSETSLFWSLWSSYSNQNNHIFFINSHDISLLPFWSHQSLNYLSYALFQFFCLIQAKLIMYERNNYCSYKTIKIMKEC